MQIVVPIRLRICRNGAENGRVQGVHWRLTIAFEFQIQIGQISHTALILVGR